jgi:prepilin-type N-terminal cleavage/methylation domain-containing protein
MSRVRFSRFLSAKPGFTLVEMLVVITIIGILASIVSVAVISALSAARRAQIKTEIDQLDGAVKTYRAKHGSFPPSNGKDLKAHLFNIFPNAIAADINQIPDNMNGAQILVFCLNGYSPDKRKPVGGTGERERIFEFKRERLQGSGFNAVYLAPNTTGTPYVYFNTARYKNKIADSNTLQQIQNVEVYTFATNNVCRPYFSSDFPGTLANEDSFQIISTGLDSEFGQYDSMNPPTSAKLFPSGANYKSQDQDNLTNFATGTLGDARP